MLYPKIGFIGLGLIGGSIAKIIKEKYPETEMIAIASRESTIQAAYADGINHIRYYAGFGGFCGL